MKRFCGFFWGLLALFCGCVDKEYDLEEIDTDNIVVGGGSLLGPLGVSTTSADKIIDVESMEELTVDENGNYVIRYADKIEVPEFTKIEIPDKTVNQFTQKVNLPQEWIDMAQVLGAFELPGSQKISSVARDEIKIDLPPEVLRLDNVVLKAGARIDLDIWKNGLEITGQLSTVDIEVEFPAGYVMTMPNPPTGAQFSGRTFTYTGLLSNFAKLPLEFVPSQIKPGSYDEIVVTATFNFKKGDLMHIAGTPEIVASGKISGLEHEVIYGEFETRVDIEPLTITTGGFDDLFTGSGNVLSFAGVGLVIDADSNIGVPLDVDMFLDSKNGGNGDRELAQLSGITIEGPAKYGDGIRQNRMWIGDSYGRVPTGYTHVRNSELAEVIKIAPTDITISGAIGTTSRAGTFFPSDPLAELDYELILPLSPGTDFKANFEETVENAFSQEAIDMMFNEGSIDLFGVISNELPLDMSVELEILNSANMPLGVKVTNMYNKPIAGCGKDGKATRSEFSFTIAKEDMHKMNSAKHVKVNFVARGNANSPGICLRPDQKVKVELKFRKTGGISLDNLEVRR